MLLKHFFTEKIAHSSYLLAGQETCAVVDPQRDVDHYIEEARRLGVRITHILQTHLHADFVSGHMELAGQTGATIYVAKSAQCTFEHIPLSEGDVVHLEEMQLNVLETPGHTPEHLSFVVVDTQRSNSPIGVFVGDTLFVGDVGRPDLFPNQVQTLAPLLYDSLHDKLLTLPDYCEVYPAHGAGSLCGRAMGAKWLSTIGYERNFNQALQIEDRQEFIRSLTEDMPPAPDHFSRCSDINRQGPRKLDELPLIDPLNAAEFAARKDDPHTMVLDIRSYLAFGGQHIKGAWHLDLNGNFPTFAGWVLPTDRDILLVADSLIQAQNAVTWARRTGVERIVGYLDGGMNDWVVSGRSSSSITLLSAEELYHKTKGDEGFTLLDVRAPLEFAAHHVEGAINIPVADLRTHHRELDPEQPVVVVCSSGNRSSLGASILKANGFSSVANLVGGMTGYHRAGYTDPCTVCTVPHGSQYVAQNR